jgi:hypothetical protein
MNLISHPVHACEHACAGSSCVNARHGSRLTENDDETYIVSSRSRLVTLRYKATVNAGKGCQTDLRLSSVLAAVRAV